LVDWKVDPGSTKMFCLQKVFSLLDKLQIEPLTQSYPHNSLGLS